MKKYGKIDYFGDLAYATNTIANDSGIIVNPTDDEYMANGYKLVRCDEIPPEREGVNIERYYEETEDTIYVRYRYSEPPVQEETETEEPAIVI